jgi:hypothetical protein
VDRFLEKPMKQVGISDTHMCTVQLLFLLANNPSGLDGYIGEDRAAFRLSTREYLTKEQAEQKHTDFVEEQIKLIQAAEAVATRKLPDSEDSDVSELSEDDAVSEQSERSENGN